jgi:hypothetical protein
MVSGGFLAFHRGSAATGRMAGEVPVHDSNHGIDRGVLDSAVPHAGTICGETLLGGRAPYEERTWTVYGWVRVPVDSVFAFCWDAVCAVRALIRRRDDQVQRASQHILHMHKSLTQRNLQIHHVLCDLNGLAAMSIVDAIVAGERDAAVLAKRRPPHIKVSEKASEATIRKSLAGNWRAEPLFALKRSRDWHRAYQQQIVAYEGYSSARTTTSAGTACCGRGCARETTLPGRGSGWRPIPYITTIRPGATISTPHESQAGPAGAITATARKIAIIFYTNGQKLSGIRCHSVGATRRSAPATLRGQTQAAGFATRLPAGAGRRKPAA